MTEKIRKGKSGSKKIGRNKLKCARYKANKTREKNKLKRVLKHNGYEAAKTYAKKHDLILKVKQEDGKDK